MMTNKINGKPLSDSESSHHSCAFHLAPDQSSIPGVYQNSESSHHFCAFTLLSTKPPFQEAHVHLHNLHIAEPTESVLEQENQEMSLPNLPGPDEGNRGGTLPFACPHRDTHPRP